MSSGVGHSYVASGSKSETGASAFSGTGASGGVSGAATGSGPAGPARCGSGEFYVAKVLDQLCRISVDCARAVEDIYQSHRPRDSAMPSSSKKGKAMDPETRSTLF